MFVKICGITNEEDALLAVALGADAVGFIFAPSPRLIVAEKVRDIVKRLPAEILTVGVFRDEHPERVLEAVRESGVKAVQLHGHESAADVAYVSRHVRTVIKAMAAGSVDVRNAKKFGTRVVLIDAPTPGSGEVFDWKLTGEIPEGINVILAGGLSPENVVAGIEIVRPWGVDVSSGVESEPGRKDPILMKRFIDAARSVPEIEYRGTSTPPYDWRDD